MHEQYLGDSFDILKRFWVHLLSPTASMLAHPRFIPRDLQIRFTQLTGAPIFDPNSPPRTAYSLLLDPHTGIPLPQAVNQNLRVSHAPIDFIASLFNDSALAFIACFDQTTKREPGISLVDQLDRKREQLLTHKISSFYYVSHAPFLFASRSPETLTAIRQSMIDAGIPTETSTTVRLQTVNKVP
jgi:hypothetical protein